MAGNTVKVDMNVSDSSGSIKARTKEASDLNKELKEAQRLASKMPRDPVAAKYRDEVTQYGRSRATTEGGTGASARDFANQAQGLGGLVRLYATYAANLFAAAAAYNALSQAFNTSNMIKGMDQLGAASGVAMGTLAQNFAKASGGAISLRESMEATAKAMSSGLTQDQFLKLGDVAKKASQALGVNMSDAVSRLTRGITKLEPELLDELGLFTRVDQAVKDFAKSTGRSEASLNSFERRMAFANAVLAEGQQKFGEIDIETNPYDKLLAKLKDTSYEILNVVNTVVSPIANVLAGNMALIGTAIGALAVGLVNQVMPQLANYRKELKESAELSKKFAESRAAEAAAVIAAERAKATAAAKNKYGEASDAASAALDKQVTALQALSKRGLSSKTQEILNPLRDIRTITKEELDYLTQMSEKRNKQTGQLTKVAEQYGKIRAAVVSAQEAETRFADIQAKRKAIEDAPINPSRFSAAGKAMRDAESARQKSASKNILSDASDIAATGSLGAAWKSINDGINTEKLNTARAGLTRLGGAAMLAGRAFSIVAGALQSTMMYIGIFIAAYQMLASVLRNNSAEMDAFNDKIGTSSAAADNATAVMKRYGNAITPESLEARATSLNNVADSFRAVAEAAEAAQEKASFWDKMEDSVMDLFGKGITDKLGEEAKKSVEAASKLFTDPKLKKSLESTVKGLTNGKDIEDFFDGLDNKEAIEAFQKLGKEIDRLNKLNITTAGSFGDAVKASKALADSYKDVEKEAKGSWSSTQKLGMSLIDASQAYSVALKDPIQSLSVINALLKDSSTLSLFGPGMQESLQQGKQELEALQKELANVNASIARNSSLAKAGPASERGMRELMVQASVIRKTELETTITSTMNNLSSKFNTAITQGIALIEQPLKNAAAEAANKMSATFASKLPKSEATANLQGKIEQRGIDVQISNIRATESLTKSIQLLTLENERNRIITDANTQAAAALAKGDTELYRLIRESVNTNPRLKELDREKSFIQSGANLRSAAAQGGPLTATMQQAAATAANTAAQVTKLLGDKQVSKFNTAVSAEEERLNKVLKDLSTTLSNREEDLKIKYDSTNFKSLPQAEQDSVKASDSVATQVMQGGVSVQKAQNALDLNKFLTEAANKFITIPADLTSALRILKDESNVLNDALAQAKKSSDGQVQNAKDISVATKEYAATISELNKESDKLNKDSQTLTLNQTNLEYVSAIRDIEMSNLSTLRERGLLSDEEYRQKEKAAQVESVSANLTLKLESLRLDRVKSINDFERRIAEAKLKNPSSVAALEQERDASTAVIDAKIAGETKLGQAKLANIDMIYDMTEREQNFSKSFISGIDAMADAFVEFARTGKLEFESLIESMLADLLRYEMRLQMMELYKGLGGAKGILGSLFGSGSFGGYSGSGINPTSLTGADITAAFTTVAAKGKAFNDSGVMAFAKGGTFTNSVVSSPTTFKFAKGTGLMGEAGPEAIMPLSRDNSGVLGVKAQTSAPKVDVVVINNSSEKAETKETTDSRGNRKVEVIIGEMVSGELARSNSPMQTSMKNTFGMTPMLTRR